MNSSTLRDETKTRSRIFNLLLYLCSDKRKNITKGKLRVYIIEGEVLEGIAVILVTGRK